MGEKIKVVVVDDHTIVRQGIRMLLTAEHDLDVIGEASNGGDAVERAKELRPDIVLMDIGMPGRSAFEATRQICAALPSTHVAMFTMYDDDDYLAKSIESGAKGYLLKDIPASELVTAIRIIHKGGHYLSQRMLSHLVDDLRERSKSAVHVTRFDTLTSREREVLKMLAEGSSAKKIATDLNLSIKTVEAHKCKLMRKLDITNQAQLVHYAIQKKIITIPKLTE